MGKLYVLVFENYLKLASSCESFALSWTTVLKKVGNFTMDVILEEMNLCGCYFGMKQTLKGLNLGVK